MGRDAKGRHFGNLKLMKGFGLKLVVSPDVFMWIMPTIITLGLFIGALWIAADRPLIRWSSLFHPVSSSPTPVKKSYSTPAHGATRQYEIPEHISIFGIIDLVGTIFLVIAALVFSLMCGLTDPGAIPRVEGETPEERAAAEAKANSLSQMQLADIRRQDLYAKHHQAINMPSTNENNNNNTNSNGTNETEQQQQPAQINLDREQLLRQGYEGHQQDSLGKIDPYADMTNWTHCRVCNLRRPPRSAHCYTCGVCVLSNDHHCGVVGGDVSLRSLRWFTLYLQCVGIAALNTMTWILGGLLDSKNRSNPSSMALHITLLVFIGNIVLMVGGLSCFYTWMVLTDLTRRESQGKGNKSSMSKNICHYHEHLNPVWQDQTNKWFGNVRRIIFPPPSLIAWE